MKTEGDTIIYSQFEVAMGQIFHQVYGSDTRLLHEQHFWKDIQELKKAAQEELEDEN